MRLSLCKLDAVKCAAQPRGEHIRLAVYILGRRDDRLAITRASLNENVFAQRDNPVVVS